METEKLKALVAKTGTIRDVSRRSGVGVSTIVTWLNGTTSPTVYMLEVLLQTCGYKLQIVPENDPNQKLYESLDRDFATGALLSERSMRLLTEARRATN
jgi:transcriptional regulator with XRE-family HTH domain